MMRMLDLHRQPFHAQPGGHVVVMVVQLHGSAGGWGLATSQAAGALGSTSGPIAGDDPMPRREPEVALLSRSVRSAVPPFTCFVDESALVSPAGTRRTPVSRQRTWAGDVSAEPYLTGD